jgi:hypothetical protein
MAERSLGLANHAGRRDEVKKPLGLAGRHDDEFHRHDLLGWGSRRTGSQTANKPQSPAFDSTQSMLGCMPFLITLLSSRPSCLLLHLVLCMQNPTTGAANILFTPGLVLPSTRSLKRFSASCRLDQDFYTQRQNEIHNWLSWALSSQTPQETRHFSWNIVISLSSRSLSSHGQAGAWRTPCSNLAGPCHSHLADTHLFLENMLCILRSTRLPSQHERGIPRVGCRDD